MTWLALTSAIAFGCYAGWLLRRLHSVIADKRIDFRLARARLSEDEIEEVARYHESGIRFDREMRLRRIARITTGARP